MASINRLILGDNLEIMRKLKTASVDLIYLDPPFFSNRNYEVIWGDSGEVRSFEDRFSGGISHYIEWLYERVAEMYRLLKPTGSLYLHCDWHADAYIRVMILDKIFGENCFRNEIIWKRTNNPKGSQFEKQCLGVATDTIFWYSKTDNYKFYEKSIRTKLSAEEFGKKYPLQDEKGFYYRGPIICSASMGARPNLVYEYKGFIPGASGWRMNRKKLEELDRNGDLGWSKTGTPFRKLRPENDEGHPIYNLWTDINRVSSTNSERIGYPTQKPEALLERIIKASSNEGDWVLDPFCGGGTTLAVADRLKRRWIGIDQSVAAIKVTEGRLTRDNSKLKRKNPIVAGQELSQEANLFEEGVLFSVELHKYDYEMLRYSNAFAFESFIVQQAGGTSNVVQRGDRGIDGKMHDGTPIQVKRSEGIGRNVVDNFVSAIRREDKALLEKCIAEKRVCGTIIAFSFGRGTIEEVARLKLEEGIIIDLKCVKDIVPIALKPKIVLRVEGGEKNEKGKWTITFKASSDSAIEVWQWDFHYKEENGFYGDVLKGEKDGTALYEFSKGEHCIAVRAIDADGIEGIESVKIHLNGKIEEVK